MRGTTESGSDGADAPTICESDVKLEDRVTQETLAPPTLAALGSEFARQLVA